MSKPLNIGMIGYGFMGRAHSNAYRQVSQFYKHAHRPVLKACSAAVNTVSALSVIIASLLTFALGRLWR